MEGRKEYSNKSSLYGICSVVRDVLTSGDITNEPSMNEWTGAEVRLMKDGKEKR